MAGIAAIEAALARITAAINAVNAKIGSGGGGTPSPSIFMPMKPANGKFIGNFANGTGLTVQIGAANRHDIAPFCTSFGFSVDQLGVSISTAVAASFVKVVIFSADAVTGRPTIKLAESLPIDSATVGTKFATLPAAFVFEAGKAYWLGVRHSATATLRASQSYGSLALTWTNAATPGVQQMLSKIETFATPAADWTYAAANHAALRVPLVLMRISG